MSVLWDLPFITLGKHKKYSKSFKLNTLLPSTSFNRCRIRGCESFILLFLPEISSDKVIGFKPFLLFRSILNLGHWINKGEIEGKICLQVKRWYRRWWMMDGWWTINDLGGLREIVSDDVEDLESQGPLDLTQNHEKKSDKFNLSWHRSRKKKTIPSPTEILSSVLKMSM